MPGSEMVMSPRHFFALVNVPLWIGLLVTSCHHVADPPPPPIGVYPLNEAELIGQLKTAYQKRDYDTFKRLFHADYQFYLNQAQPDGTTHWGLSEELRIHRRMFRPHAVQPPESPVPQELWLVSVDITLTAFVAFQDATTYYFDPTTNPTGFRRENFTVSQADYAASVFFQTQGETQYRLDGVENFVVVNDLSKTAGDDGKFLIYRWEDLGALALFANSTSTSTWTQVKSLYKW